MPIIKGLDKLVKYNDRSIKDLTTTPAAAGGGGTGAIVHIKTLTASGDSTLNFVDGASGVVLDDTYPIYKIEFINLHPSADGDYLRMNFSIDTGSNYNVSKITTHFYSGHAEADGSTAVAYDASSDYVGTGDLTLAPSVGNDNDQAFSGSMTLFNPSSTTFVKHFISTIHESHSDNLAVSTYVGGYVNSASAVDAIKFVYTSGNIASGKIKLYGILDS